MIRWPPTFKTLRHRQLPIRLVDELEPVGPHQRETENGHIDRVRFERQVSDVADGDVVGKLDQIERHDLFEDFVLFQFALQFSFSAAEIDERPGEQKLLVLELVSVLEQKSFDDDDRLELPLLDLLREAFVVLA